MRGVSDEPVGLLAVGADYRSADAGIREALAAAARGFHPWLARGGSRATAGGFVVSTCHRVEFYLAAREPFEAARELRAFVVNASGVDALAPSAPGHRVSGEAAVRHLCRVACGLESMVLGEHEISGQVRRAVSEAREAGPLPAVLNVAAAAAFASSGRVRSETTLSHGAASIAGVAVHWLANEGLLENAHVLIVGAGPVGREAATRLARRRTASITIASRSRHHALEVASNVGVSATDLSGVPRLLETATVCLAAIRTPGWRLAVDDLSAARGTAAGPLTLVDLSLPRAFDPGMAALPGIRLLTLDDLGPAAVAVRQRRRSAVPKAEAIVADEARRACAALAARARFWMQEAAS